MKSALKFLLAALAGSLCVAPAMAQREKPVGTHIGRPEAAVVPENSRLSDDDVARKVAQEFGRCAIQRFPRQADQLAEKVMTPAQVRSTLVGMTSSDCLMGGSLTMPANLMRGAIFAALYQRDFKKGQPEFLAEPFDFRPYAGTIDTSESNGFMARASLSSCLVRAEPAGSRALILSPVASADETAALALLTAKFSGCAPKGQVIRLTQEAFIGLIAESLYRESRAARLSQPASGSR